MNSTLKIIDARYSCRNYTDTPLTEEQIKAIAQAAVASPSAMNVQPWQIIIVKDKKMIDELDAAGMKVFGAMDDKSVYNRMTERGGKLFYNAACAVFIAIQPGANLDCGIVCENICIAAESMGLGSVICGLAGAIFSGEDGEKAKSTLKFPVGYTFGMSVLIGNPVEPGKPHEPDFSKVTYIG